MTSPSTLLLVPLNHLLAGHPWALERLQPHAGAIVHLMIEQFTIRWVIEPDGRFRLQDEHSAAPTVTIALPLSTLGRLAVSGAQTPLGDLRLAGNAELAETLSFVLRNLSWDPEADLAPLVGDIAAHRLVGGAMRVALLPRQTATALADNLRDYLVEEQAMLMAKQPGLALGEDIIQLRDDIARLEKRIARICSRASGST